MIAVLQFRTDISEKHEQDCFNKWLPDDEVVFMSIFSDHVEVEHPEKLLGRFDKIILAGSGEYLLSSEDARAKHILNKTKPLIDYILQQDFPALGLCFGHQLLASQLGGRVGHVEEQAEAGIQQVTLTKEGTKIGLFKNISSPFAVSQGHEDSVIALPTGAEHLASSKKCKYQAFRVRSNIYGVQFHVELDADDLSDRLDLYPQYDDYRMGLYAPDGVQGPQVLNNFAAL